MPEGGRRLKICAGASELLVADVYVAKARPTLSVGDFFENTDWRISVKSNRILDCVIPAWSAGIQPDMDVFGRILRAWMPAIHAGTLSVFFAS
jgi:hypothetical protein